MWAMLGKTPIDAVASATGQSEGQRYNYAEHTVIEGLPRLQWTADGTTDLKLDIRLHQWLGDPAARLAEIKAMAATHQAQPLVWGDGTLAGYFVVTAIDLRTPRRDGLGRLISAELGVTLKGHAKPPQDDPPPRPLTVVARIKG